MANAIKPKKHEVTGLQILEFYKQGIISATTAVDELSVSTEDMATSLKKLQAENDKRWHEEYSKAYVPDPKGVSAANLQFSDIPKVKPSQHPTYACETCMKKLWDVEEAADHLELHKDHIVVTFNKGGFAIAVMTGEMAKPVEPKPKMMFGIDFGMTNAEKTSFFLASEGGCPMPPAVEKPKPTPNFRPGQRKTLKLP